MPRTRRVDCTDPGIRRVRRGKGFSYRDLEGTTVSDPVIKARIDSLAIPPAWTDVWICTDPRGHIQATGFDKAGRKQYRYHDDWRAHRDRRNFELMLDFGRALPRLRKRIDDGLAQKRLGAERVTALAAALLDDGLFRIGNERYEDEHGTFGLTTLKVRHLGFENGSAVFKYRGKGGQISRHSISDPDVIRALRSLVRRRGASPGSNLLGFRAGREWRELSPDDVNGWIQATIGDRFSAKDFRTWTATVLAAIALAEHTGEATSATAKKRIARLVAEQVAEYLGNTAAVARGSYIDPRVFDRFNSGETIASSLARLANGSNPGTFANREAIERAVARLIAA